MTKQALHADRVLLVNWSGAVELEDVMQLMLEISRARQVLGAPLVTILVIDRDAPVPVGNVRAALASSLPRILSQCQKLLVAVQPTALQHRLLRAFFLAHSVGTLTQQRLHLCDSLSEALECAQRFAPQEVLALQHKLLKHSVQPRSTYS